MKIDHTIAPLSTCCLHYPPALGRSRESKIDSIDRTLDRSKGAPIHTVAGLYRGARLDRVDSEIRVRQRHSPIQKTGEQRFLDLAMQRIRAEMPAHVTEFWQP